MIKRLAKLRYLRVAGLAAGAVAVAGAAVIVTASAAVGHGGGSKAAIAAYMQQYLAASASALGISVTELKADIANGQSLSQVAAAKKVSEADFRTKLIANLKPVLDKAVTDKKLTTT